MIRLAWLASAVVNNAGNIECYRHITPAQHHAHTHACFWSKTFSYLREVEITLHLTIGLGFYRSAESKRVRLPNDQIPRCKQPT